MNRRFDSLLGLLLLALLVAVVVAFHHWVFRVGSFLLAVVFGIVAYAFFVRIKLGDAHFKSPEPMGGKARAPGSVRACIGWGSVWAGAAVFFLYCTFR